MTQNKALWFAKIGKTAPLTPRPELTNELPSLTFLRSLLTEC